MIGKRVAIVLRVLWNSGVAKIAVNEALSLGMRRVGVELLVLRKLKDSDELTENPNIVPVRLFEQRPIKFLSKVLDRLAILFIPIGRGRESKVDIVSLFLAPLFFSRESYKILVCSDQLAGITGLIAKKKGIPYVTYVSEPLFVSFPAGILRVSRWKSIRRIAYSLVYYLEKNVLENSARVIFNSYGTMNWVLRYFPSIQSKSLVIYPGCNPIGDFQSKREDRIIAVSRWDVGKKPEFILEVAKRCEEKCIMAGTWVPEDLRISFLKRIEELDLEGKVEVITNLSERSLTSELLRSRVYVHWISEGFSMGVLEAMGHGLPVITRRGAGVSEIIENGRNGFVINEPSRDNIVEWRKSGYLIREPDVSNYIPILQELLGNPEECKSIGEQALRTANDYSWDKHTAKLLEVIHSVVAQSTKYSE